MPYESNRGPSRSGGRRPNFSSTQQRAQSAPAQSINLDKCGCGQPKLANASMCPDCAYDQDLMTQDTYVYMLRIINDPETQRQYSGTKCHCGRRKPQYRAQCNSCEEQAAQRGSSLPPIISAFQREEPADRKPCPRCSRPRIAKYSLCRKCATQAGYFNADGDINPKIHFNICHCGRPKHPVFAECTKCYTQADHPGN